ncbi:MAG TPA: transketolase C-terminal domain-containing protein [Herpetosiphonaceae bacterium]
MSINGDAAVSDYWTQRFSGSARDVYRRTLLELARRDPRIYCLDSDMGGLETAFEAHLPAQYVDLGIAEANLMTVAAGLARAGKIPFVNTMAAFAGARAYEQVKIDIAYNNLPVRIIATHAGLSAGPMGPTHHAQQDLAAMRALPNMTVLAPADAAETFKMIQAAAYLPGPVYVRLGRRATELVYQRDYAFAIGHAVELCAGRDVTIVACGDVPVLAACAAQRELAEHGIAARVLNMHTVKPLDIPALLAAARETQAIISVEDHSIIGGLGGAIAEVLAEHYPTRMRRLGIGDVFCDRVGEHTDLLAAHGVAAAAITQTVLTVMGRITRHS